MIHLSVTFYSFIQNLMSNQMSSYHKFCTNFIYVCKKLCSFDPLYYLTTHPCPKFCLKLEMNNIHFRVLHRSYNNKFVLLFLMKLSVMTHQTHPNNYMSTVEIGYNQLQISLPPPPPSILDCCYLELSVLSADPLMLKRLSVCSFCQNKITSKM